ncbi:hypothetical protein AtEden1_Chr1g0040481 [Arabidopsis thaliana]
MWKCCTKTNSDYYQPFLMAKKAVQEENSKELVALSRKSLAFSEASRGVIELISSSALCRNGRSYSSHNPEQIDQ